MAILKLNLKQVPVVANAKGTSISAFQWVKVTMFVSIFKDSYPTSKREKDWGVIGWVFPILYSLSFLKARAFMPSWGVAFRPGCFHDSIFVPITPVQSKV